MILTVVLYGAAISLVLDLFNMLFNVINGK